LWLGGRPFLLADDLMATVSPPVPMSLSAPQPAVRAWTAMPSLARRAAVPGFFLFILLNATLFLRPSEILPALEIHHLYLIVIVPCLALALPAVLEQLTSRSLSKSPLTVCVLGILAAVLLSHLSHLNLEGAAKTGFEFAKMVVYFLLLVGIVNSVARLRIFLLCFTLFALALTILAVLQFHGFQLVHIQALKDLDKTMGHEVSILRLQATGIFHDPNDLCLVLTAGAVLSLYWIGERRMGLARFLWVGALVLFAYALYLTRSRGGFLALVVGILVFLGARFGRSRAILLAALLLPALLLFFGGRQTDLSATQSTGRTRVQLWSDSLMVFKQNPLFGIGQEQLNPEIGQVAHNSFLHAFAELGFLGGMFFLGAFFFAFRGLVRAAPRRGELVDPEWRRLYPYVLGVVAAYTTGMMTLSVGFIVPTYTILGLALVYLRTAPVWPPRPAPAFDGRLVGQMALGSVLFLAAMHGFVLLVLHT
jgi:O-antigen ligase